MYNQLPRGREAELNGTAMVEPEGGSEHGTLPGWVCVAIGVGFIATLVLGLVGVRILAG